MRVGDNCGGALWNHCSRVLWNCDHAAFDMYMAVDEPWSQDLVLQGDDLASAAAFKAHDPALVYGNV